jgi:hypothetical protein
MRKIVYCSSCGSYYEDRTVLIRLKDSEVTEEEKIQCLNPVLDLASNYNNSITCGCRKSFNDKGWKNNIKGKLFISLF